MTTLKPRFTNYFALLFMGIFWLAFGVASWQSSDPIFIRTLALLLLGLTCSFRGIHVLLHLRTRYISADQTGITIGKNESCTTIEWSNLKTIRITKNLLQNTITIIPHFGNPISINCRPYGKVETVLKALNNEFPRNA
jgi:hypothetical protein